MKAIFDFLKLWFITSVAIFCYISGVTIMILILEARAHEQIAEKMGNWRWVR